MKTAKILVTLLFPILSVMVYQTADAQGNCPGGKVRISFGLKGSHCSCQKKCVNSSEVAGYQATGWRVGDCPQYNCNWGGGFRRIEEDDMSTETFLTDIYPNPSTSSTTIFFSLSQAQQVSFKVFDMSGRLITTITDQESGEGENQITWNTSDVKAGIYFLRMESGSYSEMKKVSVLNL